MRIPVPPLLNETYGRTRKGTLLDNVPMGVLTSMDPVLAPAGTVAEMAAPASLTVN